MGELRKTWMEEVKKVYETRKRRKVGGREEIMQRRRKVETITEERLTKLVTRMGEEKR